MCKKACVTALRKQCCSPEGLIRPCSSLWLVPGGALFSLGDPEPSVPGPSFFRPSGTCVAGRRSLSWALASLLSLKVLGGGRGCEL